MLQERGAARLLHYAAVWFDTALVEEVTLTKLDN